MTDDERTRIRRPVAQFRSTVRAPAPSTSAPAVPNPNRYEGGTPLGQGGMGRVERGIDHFLGREVALKRSLSTTPEMLESLLREAEVAARLDHPSIVTIHDVSFDAAGEPVVVMRLVDGEPLSKLVGSPDLTANLRLLPRVLPAIEAIAFAHRHGVIHRDLKPANIIVGELGNTVVIDWGLALDLRAGADPFAGSPAGTPGFMSPEQIRGEVLDERADVYALGVTLFLVLTGQLPGATETGVTIAAGSAPRPPPGPPRSLGVVASGAPHDLVTIVDKACALDPDARYGTAEELAAELQRFIGGQLVAAHHYSPAQRTWRWIRRHRVGVAVAGVALTASLTIGAVSIRRVLAASEVAERERATAVAAQHQADARADELLLDRARAVISADPARALALLDLRHEPNTDAAAWAIAVEATARGVPHVWKAHDRPIAHVVALGGGRVVSGDLDGNVVLRDRDGSHRTLVTYPRPITGLVDVPGGYVVATENVTENLIERFDDRGASLVKWPNARRPDGLTSSAGWLVSWDRVSMLARKLDGSTERTADFAGGALAIGAIDPTGRWWALAGQPGVTLVELATGEPRVLDTRRTLDVQWSPGGDRLLATIGDDQVEWTIADGSQRSWHVGMGPSGYLGDAPMMFDNQGCGRLLTSRTPFDCVAPFAWVIARRGGLVAAAGGRGIAVYRPSGTRRLVAPGVASRLALDPTGHELAAMSRDGTIAWWDLEATGMRARELRVQAIAMTGEGLAVDDHGDFVELGRDATRIPIGSLEFPYPNSSILPLDHHVFAVLDVSGTLVTLHAGERIPVATEVARVVPLDGHEIVFADARGRVVIYDAGTRASYVVKTHAAPIVQLGADGLALVALWEDGALWWRDRTGQEHEARVGCAAQGAMLHDDAVDVACGGELREVSATGQHSIVTLAEPISQWIRTAGFYVLMTGDHAIWRFDGTATQLVAPNDGAEALGPARFVTVDPLTNEIYVHDVASGARAWIGTIESPDGISISPDGRRVVVTGRDQVLEWRDPMSADPADWASQRAALTNATLSEPSAALIWR